MAPHNWSESRNPSGGAADHADVPPFFDNAESMEPWLERAAGPEATALRREGAGRCVEPFGITRASRRRRCDDFSNEANRGCLKFLWGLVLRRLRAWFG